MSSHAIPFGVRRLFYFPRELHLVGLGASQRGVLARFLPPHKMFGLMQA